MNEKTTPGGWLALAGIIAAIVLMLTGHVGSAPDPASQDQQYQQDDGCFGDYTRCAP